MRVIFVLFDSLNRSAIGAYGSKALKTPNFDRFADRAVTFDRHYVGSLPCMPARRDMHTGRLNFMHRPWGPLEPFDNSYASLFSENGVYSHLVSDHLHYFENGGWGYTGAFDSWDFIRGQEYDPIAVMVKPPIERLQEMFDSRHYPLHELTDGQNVTHRSSPKDAWRRSRHAVNMHFTKDESDFPLTKCFSSAFEFLDTNKSADSWFLQLECFDPHEPFAAPERFKNAYNTNYNGKILNWPVYEKVTDSAEEIEEIRANYAALVAMCDEYFGRLLDWLDQNDAWSNTVLILTTDHGFLLGEHEWWGKNKMPYYEEISHIPLMIWHPKTEIKSGKRLGGLTQTTDLMPTLLDIFGIPIPREVTAHSLMPMLNGQKTKRNSAILGMFAGPICVTDGRFTYYKFPEDSVTANLPLYTVMPSHLESMFSVEEMRSAELVDSFEFTKGMPILKISMDQQVKESGLECVANWERGSSLYDLETDPEQTRPIDDAAMMNRLSALIVKELQLHSAPEEVYTHYGLTEWQEQISA